MSENKEEALQTPLIFTGEGHAVLPLPEDPDNWVDVTVEHERGVLVVTGHKNGEEDYKVTITLSDEVADRLEHVSFLYCPKEAQID